MTNHLGTMVVDNGLGSFLKELRSRGMLKEISLPLSPRFEVAAAEQHLSDEGPVLLNRIKGYDIPVVFNIVSSKELYALALGTDIEGVQQIVRKAVSEPLRPQRSKSHSWKRMSNDCSFLPVVTHFEKDQGPYITSSLVIAKNEQTGTQNLSVHRLLRLDESHFAVRMVEGRHLHRAFSLMKEKGKDLPVAIVIGAHPAVEIAASYQAPYGLDELGIANALLSGELAVSRLDGGLEVPSAAEIVSEGRILHDRTAQDCMVEMLGNYDTRREQPVLEVECVYIRPGAVFRDILPGGREHRLLMSYSVEMKISRAVTDVVPSTRRVVLTDGGCNWLHAVIQMKKRLEGEPKNAIMAAFAAHPSLKHVVVVDEDIDPSDPRSVEYAIATRFQAGRGLLIIKGAKGSSLDPSSDQEELLTDKVGFDATATLSKEWSRFEKGIIPGSEAVAKKLQASVGRKATRKGGN